MIIQSMLRYTVPLISLFLCGAQEEASRQARRLVERLRSDRVEDRDEAARMLEKLGPAALPYLDKAQNDSDLDVQTLAGNTAKVIRTAEKLSTRLKAALPGAERRLAFGDGGTWTQVFFEATAEDEGKRRYPILTMDDLEPLALPAVRGAKDAKEKTSVCWRVKRWGLRSAIPGLGDLLKDEERSVRADAVRVLGCLGARESVPAILPLLEDSDLSTSSSAAWALARLDARDSLPEVARLLQDHRQSVRLRALETLPLLDAKEWTSSVARLLEDEDGTVRGVAAQTLAELQAWEAIPAIAKRLDDKNDYARRAAVEALGKLEAKEFRQALVPLLANSCRFMRKRAALSLCELGGLEGIPVVLKEAGKAEVRGLAAGSIGTLDAESEPLFEYKLDFMLNSLNAVRQPEAWRSLRRARVTADLKGSREEVLERAAGSAGLTIEWQSASCCEESRWREEPVEIWSCHGRKTVFEVLEDILNEPYRAFIEDTIHKDGIYRIVLDGNRLRFLPRDEALKLWRAWWRQQENKADK